MHGLFLFSSLALLFATIWMLAQDSARPWKDYQRAYRKRYAPQTPLGIRQISLPELTQDFNFRPVARCDRCTTCHLGIDRDSENLGPDNEIPHPFQCHPRLDLFVAENSPHPLKQFGCTICHEGQGGSTDFCRASHAPSDATSERAWKERYAWSRDANWDSPMLPARFAESRCLKCHPSATDLEPTARFPDPPAPKLLAGYHLVRRLGCFGCHEISGYDADGRIVGPDMRLEKGEREEGRGEREQIPPGSMRKVGPSLRQVAETVSQEYLADRIADPSHFLPESTMPRLFGINEHLEGPALKEANRFEAVEILAISTYLLQAAEPSQISPTPDAATAVETPSAVRGKKLFQMQGCLACHKHQDFPEGRSIQGPELSRIGAKYTAPNARRWLVDWLRDPVRHSPRTVMPNPRLEKTLSAEDGRATDPAEDLAAYLLASRANFQTAPLPSPTEKDLCELSDGQTVFTSASYIAHASKGNERIQKKLFEFGQSAILKRGCAGCHDIPGCEQTQGIGPALAGWGRKPTSQLAFDKIGEYVTNKSTHASTNPADGTFFMGALLDRRREGFLWQKLREPRSFDYLAWPKKNYNAYLRMGRFNLTDAEREAVMTFVLGFTADPPRGKYAYAPDVRRKAVIEGRKALDRFACAECHTLEHERWTIAYKPGEMPSPPPFDNFDFVKPRLSEAERAASRIVGKNGLCRAELAGMPRLDSAGNPIEDEDDDGRPIRYFTLWKPAAVDGRLWPVGGPDVTVPSASVIKKRPAWGGTLPRMLYPTILADAKQKGSRTPELEAWSWLPPPLTMEGQKVRADWLNDYLLGTASIRPGSILLMPQFNLSPDEAVALTAYFTAADPNPTSIVLPKSQVSNSSHDRALKFILDAQNSCAKCHVIGDYRPGGRDATIVAPNLAQAGRRLRPQYLRRWLADPQSILPYSPMPKNFPFQEKPSNQKLLPGDSLERLDAVERLLLQFDDYAKEKMSIREMMPKPQKPSDGL